MPGGTIPGWVYGIVLPTSFQFRKIGISSCGNLNFGLASLQAARCADAPEFSPLTWCLAGLIMRKCLASLDSGGHVGLEWWRGKVGYIGCGLFFGFVRLHRFRVAVWVAWSLANESLDSSPNATGSLDFSVIDTSVYQGFEFLPWGRMSKGQWITYPWGEFFSP